MGRSTLDPLSLSYPDWARILSQPPALRIMGSLGADEPRVAVVGTRKPTREAEAFAFDLAGVLSEAGVVVWSGGALGIDSAAHRGAIAMNRPTVAVLGSGLDRPFPPENTGLFEKIVEAGGALVSQFNDDDHAMPQRFLARNRVLAAAVSLLVIVECDMRSGALNAAKWARSLGKRVAVVPQAPWAIAGRGCLDEIRRGATAVASADDVLRLVGVRPPRVSKAQTPSESAQIELALAKADPREARLLELLTTPRTTADVSETLGEPPGAVAALLLDLTLRDVIEETTGGLLRLK